MSRVCRHLVAETKSLGKSVRVDEREVMNMAPRIIALGDEYSKHFPILPVGKDQDKRCFLQTLLKGSFSLLGVKMP